VLQDSAKTGLDVERQREFLQNRRKTHSLTIKF